MGAIVHSMMVVWAQPLKVALEVTATFWLTWSEVYRCPH